MKEESKTEKPAVDFTAVDNQIAQLKAEAYDLLVVTQNAQKRINQIAETLEALEAQKQNS